MDTTQRPVPEHAGATSGCAGAGRATYGHELGILMLDTTFPRPLGDVGHARTWPFPVLYEVISDASPKRVMTETDPALLDPFVAGAQRLANSGVRMITTSCGFLSVFQQDLARSLPVPVLTSALLQVPLAAAQIGSDRTVGILTERSDFLTEAHFRGAGWSSQDIPIAVQALAPDALFPRIYGPKLPDDPAPHFDARQLENEVVDAGRQLIARQPAVSALVLECTNFVPYSQALRHATGVPVFDLYTLVMHSYLTTIGTKFPPAS